MANFATTGFLVPGFNNVKVRLYPQVIGIHKIHEHNLCNALRDFGLILKSDSRYQLLNYKNEFLKFVHLMRSSEICMLSHGYSSLKMFDMDWWNQFVKLSSDAIYDMDGKEIGGFLYSLSKVFTEKNYLIDKLFDESISWMDMYTPLSVSLLVKSASNFKCGPEMMKMLNKRILQLLDDMNVVDIIFFMTSNVESRTQDINLFRLMSTKLIEMNKQIDLHHIRAIAASISMAGFKSHILFNVLTLRLKELHKTHMLTETDVVSLLLSFTTQRFLHHNDLCIDTKVYENFLKGNPTTSKNIYVYPLPEFGPIFSEAIAKNISRITSNGIPILIRAVSILKIPLDENLKESVIDKAIENIDQDEFKGSRLCNLVVSCTKFAPTYPKIWKAIYGTFTRQEDLDMNGDMMSKMINTISTLGKGNIDKSEELSLVYDFLLEKCQERVNSMGSRSILSINRLLTLNLDYDLLISDDYLDALNKYADQFTKPYAFKILKCYVDCVDNIKSKDKFLMFLKSIEAALERHRDENCYFDKEIKELIKMFMSKLDK